MVDVWLIILCIVVPCVLTFINMLFMAYFMSSNKNEREHTTFPRVVVVSAAHRCGAHRRN